jgi:hypothetical protein
MQREAVKAASLLFLANDYFTLRTGKYVSSKRWQGPQHTEIHKSLGIEQTPRKPLQSAPKMLGTGADGERNSGIYQAISLPPFGSS